MRIFRNHTKNQGVNGQAVLEYAGLLGIIALALCAFAMRSYLKSAIMGKMHQDMTRTFGDEQHYSTTNKELIRTVNENVSVDGNGLGLFGIDIFSLNLSG